MRLRTRVSLERLRHPSRWGMLILLSAIIAGMLQWVHLPASLLLGPMIAGIVMATAGASLRVPSRPYNVAQAVIGCLVARAITPEIVSTFLKQWPLFIGVVLITLLACGMLGWAISRLRIMPGTVAVWGLLPGGASAMMLMAEAYGADMRLVAFMQYLRVVIVALLAALIARFWVHVTPGAHRMEWFAPVHWPAFAETLILVLVGVFLGRASRLPAGVVLLPLLVGSFLHAMGIMTIELPQPLLAVSYLFLGWTIGMRFTRHVLAHAIRALPQIVLSILIIIGFCGGLAFLLVKLLGIDPLTAYLATSPGGLDSVAIIAASTKVDVPFVMALQTVRLMLVLLIGPSLSRWFARRLPAQNPDIKPSLSGNQFST